MGKYLKCSFGFCSIFIIPLICSEFQLCIYTFFELTCIFCACIQSLAAVIFSITNGGDSGSVRMLCSSVSSM